MKRVDARLSIWGRSCGYVSFTLGLLAVGAVMCFHYPYYLTTPSLRAIYPMELLRDVLKYGMAAAVMLGGLAVTLTSRRFYGLAGIFLALLALALGGHAVHVYSPVPPSKFLALDFLILDFLIVTALFIPLERLFVRRREQKIFRGGWKTDVKHYAVNHLLSGATILVITAPAAWLRQGPIERTVSSLPLLAQVLLALFFADLFQYWIHRAFHRVPLLWRFHAIHHSSEQMDWLAGSRLHLVDIVLTRGISFIPLGLMGLSGAALHVYLVIVAYQSVFIHSNTRFLFRGWRWITATPAFHHWHHSNEKEAIDKNFAVSLPLFDLIFGTFYLPRGGWPTRYGLVGESMPESYFRQVVHPFLRRR